MKKRLIVHRGVADMNKTFHDQFYKENSVLMELHSVPVIIKRFYTDVDGQILDKNDLTIPDDLKVKLPVFLFGQFDRNGGYKRLQQAVPTVGGQNFFMTYTQGVNSPFLPFTGLNTIKGQIKTGDIVIVYTDHLENPNFFTWIVVSSENVSLASITSNTESLQLDGRIGQLWFKETNLKVDVESQFYEPLFFSQFDNIGNYRFDTIQPNMFLTPHVAQHDFLTLDTPFKLDQYLGLAFYIQFACDLITLNFKVEKI